MLVALFFRVQGLAAESAWVDEVCSLECLSEPTLSAYLERYTAVDPTMGPVYFTLQYEWSRIFGSSVLAIRAMSVVFGMASVLVLLLLGKAMFSTRAGLVAAFYAALSLLHIYYSQEIRTYPLVLFLAALSMYTFLGAVKTNRASRWILHGVVNGFLAGTHVIAAFLLVPQALYLLLFRRKQPRYFAVWFLCQIAALLPVVALMAGRYSSAREMLFFIHSVSWYDLCHTFLILAGGRWRHYNPAPDLPGGISLDAVLAVYAGFLALLLFYKAFAKRRAHTEAATKPDTLGYVMLLAFWLFIPPLMLFALSHSWHRCFQFRYIVYASLPLHLLAGGGIDALSTRARVRAGFAVLAILLGYQALALRSGPLRVDYAGAARHIEERWTPGDQVVAFKSTTDAAFRFNSTVPDDSVVTTESFGDMVVMTENACREGGAAWVLMFMWEYPEWFEDRVDKAGLVYEMKRFGRHPHLIMYRVSTPRTDLPAV
jgi:hypothetical protein